MEEEIRCKKWMPGGGVYRCEQAASALCGCESSVELPSVLSILSGEQKDERDRAIEEMRKSIRKDRAALVLGAGISKRAGMPAWSGLISKMMGYAIQYDQLIGKRAGVIKSGEDEKKRLLELTDMLISGKLSLLGKVNTLESAQYVAQLFGTSAVDSEKLSIGAMVRRIVDQSIPPRELLLDKRTGLLDDIQKIDGYESMSAAQLVEKLGGERVAQSESMFAVSRLLSEKKGIRRAITYNYDPLVQEYMTELYQGTDVLTHPCALGKGKPRANTREIYHVHGFVPGERHLGKGNERAFPGESGSIILSENSYYRMEQTEAYDWPSSIQSYFLNQYQCIFVGFSAEDYNFRRILRQIGAGDPEKPHYLILSVRRWISDTYEEVCRARLRQSGGSLGEDDLKNISRDAILLLRYVLACRAVYWRKRSIYPIWVTTKEIPQLLTALLPA